MTPVLGLNAVGSADWIGGSIYVRNLAVCLTSLPASERPQIVLVGGASRKSTGDILRLQGVRLGRQGYWLDRSRWSQRLAFMKRLVLRKLLGRHRDPWFDGIDAIYPVLAPLGLGRREIYWVPDFQQAHLPELFQKDELEQRAAHISRMAESSNILVLSSKMAADDFARLYPGAPTKVRILRFCSIPEIPAAPRDPRPAYGLPARYLYVANQFWAHKNHGQVFEALALLRDRGIVITLVCTGKMSDYRNPDYIESLKRLIVEQDLSEQIHLLDIVPRDDQIELFRHAAAIVQPSTFEGWSTVIEDARAIGRPIVASDFPVHREQVPQAHFFPLGNAPALADLLADLWPKLAAGPDLNAEAAARQSSLERQMECAREFMAILSEAVDLQKNPAA